MQNNMKEEKNTNYGWFQYFEKGSRCCSLSYWDNDDDSVISLTIENCNDQPIHEKPCDYFLIKINNLFCRVFMCSLCVFSTRGNLMQILHWQPYRISSTLNEWMNHLLIYCSNANTNEWTKQIFLSSCLMSKHEMNFIQCG